MEEVNGMIQKIITEVQETEDEFIFTTIQPYCENVFQRKISKKELESALLLWEQAKKLTRRPL